MLTEALTGAITGGLFGKHFGAGWKGAAIGFFGGAAYDVLTPDRSSNRGVLWNTLAGVAGGASFAALSSLGSASYLPGGGGSKIAGYLNKLSKPVMRYLFKPKSGEPKSGGILTEIARKTMTQGPKSGRNLYAGPGNLGWYNLFTPSDTRPEFWKSMFSSPTLANAITSSSPAKSLKQLDSSVIKEAIAKDVKNAVIPGMAIGGTLGALSGFYYNKVRVPDQGGVYGGGMYNVAGLPSNRPLNPIMSAR